MVLTESGRPEYRTHASTNHAMIAGSCTLVLGFRTKRLPLFTLSMSPQLFLGLKHHVRHTVDAFALAIDFGHAPMDFGRSAISLQGGQPADYLGDSTAPACWQSSRTAGKSYLQT